MEWDEGILFLFYFFGGVFVKQKKHPPPPPPNKTVQVHPEVSPPHFNGSGSERHSRFERKKGDGESFAEI